MDVHQLSLAGCDLIHDIPRHHGREVLAGVHLLEAPAAVVMMDVQKAEPDLLLIVEHCHEVQAEALDGIEVGVPHGLPVLPVPLGAPRSLLKSSPKTSLKIT